MTKMTNAKFKVENFSDINNFALCKLKVRDLLMQQGLHKALDRVKKKPAGITNLDRGDLDARALNTIKLCLVDEVLFNIVEETLAIGLWGKTGNVVFDQHNSYKNAIVQSSDERGYKNCRTLKCF